MRVAAPGLLLLFVLSACAQSPLAPSPEPIPVVALESTIHRYLPDGTRWEPAHRDPCPDGFEVRTGDRQVRVDDWLHGTAERTDARAAVSLPVRRVEPAADPQPNHTLELPPVLPWTHTFVMGSVRPYDVTLRVEAGTVTFNAAGIPQGGNQTQRFDYEWRRADGVVLNVTETIRTEYLGDWVDPFVPAASPTCP